MAGIHQNLHTNNQNEEQNHAQIELQPTESDNERRREDDAHAYGVG
jgi:hypothetical protein